MRHPSIGVGDGPARTIEREQDRDRWRCKDAEVEYTFTGPIWAQVTRVLRTLPSPPPRTLEHPPRERLCTGCRSARLPPSHPTTEGQGPRRVGAASGRPIGRARAAAETPANSNTHHRPTDGAVCVQASSRVHRIATGRMVIQSAQACRLGVFWITHADHRVPTPSNVAYGRCVEAMMAGRRKRSTKKPTAEPVLRYWAVGFLDILGYRDVLNDIHLPLHHSKDDETKSSEAFARALHLRERLLGQAKTLQQERSSYLPILSSRSKADKKWYHEIRMTRPKTSDREERL